MSSNNTLESKAKLDEKCTPSPLLQACKLTISPSKVQLRPSYEAPHTKTIILSNLHDFAVSFSVRSTQKSFLVAVPPWGTINANDRMRAEIRVNRIWNNTFRNKNDLLIFDFTPAQGVEQVNEAAKTTSNVKCRKAIRVMYAKRIEGKMRASYLRYKRHGAFTKAAISQETKSKAARERWNQGLKDEEDSSLSSSDPFDFSKPCPTSNFVRRALRRSKEKRRQQMERQRAKVSRKREKEQKPNGSNEPKSESDN